MLIILDILIKLILALHIVILYSTCLYFAITGFHCVYSYTIQNLTFKILTFPYYITVLKNINIKKNTEFSKLTLENIKIEELKDRLTSHIPPGFKDKKLGDTIIWYTILEFAKIHKKNVIFVTDEKKEDWWYKAYDHILYPRYELIEEFRRCSEGKTFHLINFSAFLKLFKAEKDVIKEVKELEAKKDDKVLEGYILQRKLTKAISEWIKKYVLPSSQFLINPCLSCSDTNRNSFMTIRMISSNNETINKLVLDVIYIDLFINSVSLRNSFRTNWTIYVADNELDALAFKNYMEQRSINPRSPYFFGYLTEDNQFMPLDNYLENKLLKYFASKQGVSY